MDSVDENVKPGVKF
jgi:hypothetical protein